MNVFNGGIRHQSFFIVGEPKCGTAAILQVLGQRPQIFTSQFKEPMCLADDLRQTYRLPNISSAKHIV
jgi:hypothetical protein